VTLEAPPITDDADKVNAYAAAKRDPMFEEAVGVLLDTGVASLSVLQRRLKVGYKRASNLLEMMAACGLVKDRRVGVTATLTITHAEWLALETAAHGVITDLAAHYVPLAGRVPARAPARDPDPSPVAATVPPPRPVTRPLDWTESCPRRPGLYLLQVGFLGPDVVRLRPSPKMGGPLLCPGWACGFGPGDTVSYATVSQVPAGALWLGPLPAPPKALPEPNPVDAAGAVA